MNDHYSPEFMSLQEEALLKEKARIEKELEAVAVYDPAQGRYVPKFEEFNAGDAEDAEEASDEATTLGENTAVADNLVKSLEEVKRALQDTAAGRYGFCENCGEYISEERLKAYPAAKTCTKCE